MSAGKSCESSTVVLVDDRLAAAVPAAAIPLVRSATEVYADPGLVDEIARELGAVAAPDLAGLLSAASREPIVLVAPMSGSDAADALREAGARIVPATPPVGVELLEAVTVMDRLRSPGGCPWDAEQDHESLRRYLVEETYELLDAIEHDDRVALREELGDVLLQVLFHTRVAAEDVADPFGIDEVAAALVSKLVSRHPHVFGEGEHLHDAESQQVRWEELKQREKRRESVVDGVALGQPAVALTAKLAQRVERADFPVELLPDGDGARRLFALAARARLDGADPEDELRGVALEFADSVRSAESRAQAHGADGIDSADQWRTFWSPGPDPTQDEHRGTGSARTR